MDQDFVDQRADDLKSLIACLIGINGRMQVADLFAIGLCQVWQEAYRARSWTAELLKKGSLFCLKAFQHPFVKVIDGLRETLIKPRSSLQGGLNLIHETAARDDSASLPL